MRFRDLLNMVSEIAGDIDIELRPPEEGDARHGTSGDFMITPYTFRPKMAKKLVANPYLDMGQGLLECMEEIYEELGRPAPPITSI